MKKQIITITGAAGNIAYSLIFRILAGNIFDQDTKIQLNLLNHLRYNKSHFFFYSSLKIKLFSKLQKLIRYYMIRLRCH